MTPALDRDAANRQEFFPDADLVEYVRETYGSRMADRMADFMECDPLNETGFMRSVRRSLTNEMGRAMQSA